jgi:hypothetical protein
LIKILKLITISANSTLDILYWYIDDVCNDPCICRFFLGDAAVQVLVDYAVCQTRREEAELKVLLCWPRRRDLVTGPRTASLREAGLGRQETITVEVVEEEEE